MQTGADALIHLLKQFDVDTVYCVPGESYLAALDSLHEESAHIKLITCRHESGAANMAEAYGKLTKKPGICFVTRGPGATNASIGVHTAFQDSTPMILFIGQVAREHMGREGFQEVDFCQMFRPLAKWVVEITDPNRMSELIYQAFTKALNGRPGPVVISLPEDMLRQEITLPQRAKSLIRPCPRPHLSEMQHLQTLLEAAQKPFFILGGSGWDAASTTQILQFSKQYHIPLATSFRCQDLVNNQAPQFVGDVGIAINPKLAQNIKSSDLIVAIGPRLGEMTTNGYTLFEAPVPQQQLVHIHVSIDELGRVYQPDLAIHSDIPAFISDLSHLTLTPKPAAWLLENRQHYEAFSSAFHNYDNEPSLNLAMIVAHLRDILPNDAIITNGAGNYAGWVHRYYYYRHFKSQLAPTSGAMGYGFPAAIAAKIHYPERPVICFAGDGCFMMSVQEMATAMRYNANVITLLVNNNMYGTIRMHQERHYPHHVHGTMLTNPNFSELAQSFGAFGASIDKTDQFADVFQQALAANKPALIELCVDAHYITPQLTLEQIQKQAIKDS